ncbi:hypothetical protein NBH00_12340 [Paraconexibacter antarcticus]|uniref:Zinc ribbon domain-containing protein n=1 Tax=Paraconexibacter antarcticus TaxID=2949664 RepID=A0ABY5DY62_9ACTN|nr:hypothetical protein [Paraconexibacter antarcticus]UTI66968.1 hypothetical protein NBH00_12340 [Paraconexibacter antarcticus]
MSTPPTAPEAPEAQPPLPPPGTIPCPRCQALVGPQQDWCLSCGAPARTRLAPAPNWKLPLAIAGSLMALAAIVLVVAFVALTNSSDPATGTTITTSTTVPPAATTPGVTTTPGGGTTVPGTSTAAPAPGATTATPPAATPPATTTNPATSTVPGLSGTTTAPAPVTPSTKTGGVDPSTPPSG